MKWARTCWKTMSIDINYSTVPVLQKWLGGGFKYFLFSSLPGEMIQFVSIGLIFFKWVETTNYIDWRHLGDLLEETPISRCSDVFCLNTFPVDPKIFQLWSRSGLVDAVSVFRSSAVATDLLGDYTLGSINIAVHSSKIWAPEWRWCMYFLSKMGDIPASYVSWSQRVDVPWNLTCNYLCFPETAFFLLTKQHCRWKLRTTVCSRTLTGRFGKHGPSYLWSQNSTATRILNPAHSFTLYAFYLWWLEKIPCYTKCFLKKMILGTNKYIAKKLNHGLLILTISLFPSKIEWGPYQRTLSLLELWDTQVFFRGPWNVGPVGDFWDYCDFFLVVQNSVTMISETHNQAGGWGW